MQSVLAPELSLVVPVYRNEGSIGQLIAAVRWINEQVRGSFEAVFVVDGSPDTSYALLHDALSTAGFKSQLVVLSRNFGAFAAIRTGLEISKGKVIAVMAADLQEPPELIIKFLSEIRRENSDVAIGVRESRNDPIATRLTSGVFWAVYKRFVMPEIPKGGVDIFAVTSTFRDRLVALREANSSLLAQIFWLGGRRVFVPYQRLSRQHGKSAWTFKKKLRYLSDSVFAFTDLPVRILMLLGVLTLGITTALCLIILAAKLTGMVAVPGYAGTMITILFFGAFNSLGLGVVGSYAWRTFENTKSRPLSIVNSVEEFDEAQA